MPCLEDFDQIYPDLCCPITGRFLIEPFTPGDGFAYEKRAIEKLDAVIELDQTNKYGKFKKITPDYAVKKLIQLIRLKHEICSDQVFWAAIKSGKPEELEKLNYIKSQLHLTTINESTGTGGYTPFLWCAMKGHIALMEHLLKLGSDANAKNTKGLTAAAFLAITNNKAGLELLISKGVNVDEPSEDGKTAVMWAILGHHGDCVRLLVQKGAVLTDEAKKLAISKFGMAFFRSLQGQKSQLSKNNQLEKQTYPFFRK